MPKGMEAGGASSRKRKSAALEIIGEAPTPVAIVAQDPLPLAGDDAGRVGEEGGDVDRLSSLSDDILGEIISLLTIKEGARTGILASRWRDLWLSAPLNLDLRELTAGPRRTVCADVVSHILSSHHGPVRRLYVNTWCLRIPADTVEACLRSASIDNLEELDFFHRQLEHPQRASIFRFSTTLRVLNIGRCNLSDVTFQGLNFPVLQKLGLAMVRISECSLHTLLFGCPALESFLIYYNYGVTCIRINSLTIRSVSVLSNERAHHSYRRDDLELLQQLVIENAPCLLRLLLLHPKDRLHVSVVAAPKLETLGFISDMCSSSESSTVVFGSTVIQGLRIDKLILEVHTVKTLGLCMRDLCLDTVIELMRCFPCLEKLYIESYPLTPSKSNVWRRKHRNLIGCFGMRLKTIVLTEYRGLKSQVNFITFFVLNANLLESVTVGIEPWNNNKKFSAQQRTKLQIENSASSDVRLHFKTSSCVRCILGDMDVRDYDLADPFAG